MESVSHAPTSYSVIRGSTNITTSKLPGSIRRQDQDNQGNHKLGDAKDEVPPRLGRDMRAIMGVLAAGPGIVGEVCHIIGDPMTSEAEIRETGKPR
jgi:hypothetical protein